MIFTRLSRERNGLVDTEWLNTLKFERSASKIVFQEYLHHLQEVEQRVKPLEEEIKFQSTEGYHAPMIQALQSLRGIATITATSLVAEIGSFNRFASPKKLMSYVGLIPSESSSGETRRQGNITKTGNRHVRRLLVEAAWSYRHKPALKEI